MTTQRVTFTPCNPQQAQEWIGFLENIVMPRLADMPKIETENALLGSDDGDVSTLQNMAGTLLATLKGEEVSTYETLPE